MTKIEMIEQMQDATRRELFRNVPLMAFKTEDRLRVIGLAMVDRIMPRIKRIIKKRLLSKA